MCLLYFQPGNIGLCATGSAAPNIRTGLPVGRPAHSVISFRTIFAAPNYAPARQILKRPGSH